MLKFGDEKGQLKCSFCGKTQEQVRKLIAGPGVYICDECIDICAEIIQDEFADDIDTDIIMSSAKALVSAVNKSMKESRV